MSIILVLAALIAIYVAISADAIANAKNRWSARSNMGKIAKAGTVAAIKTLRSFLQIAIITLAAVLIIFQAAIWISPILGGDLLARELKIANWFKDIMTTISAGLGTLGFVIAVGALFWIAVRARTGQLRQALSAEHIRQMRELADKAVKGELESLESSEEMQKISAAIDEIERTITRHGAQPELVQQRRGLLTLYEFTNLDRRVELTELPIVDDAIGGFWPRIGIFIFSEGFETTHEWISRQSSRVATAATCLALLGVSAPLIATAATPVIESIFDLQIAVTSMLAKQSLASMATEPPPEGAEPSEAQNYQNVATQVARNIAFALAKGERTTPFPSVPPSPPPPLDEATADMVKVDRPASAPADIEQLALRQTIAKEYADHSFVAGTTSVIDVAPDLGPVSNRARARYEILLAVGSPPRPADTRRTTQWLDWVADRHPKAKARLDAYLVATSTPRSIGSFEEAVLGDLVADLLDKAIPEPGNLGDFASKPSSKIVRKSLESGVSDFATRALNDFLRNIAGPMDVRQALDRVRRTPVGHLTLTSAEIDALHRYASGLSGDRAELQRGLSQARVTLAAADSDNAATSRLVKALSIEPTTNRAREAAGGYDDLFPGTGRKAWRTSLLRLSPQTIGYSQAEVVAARNFAVLGKNPHVGGVVLGRSATGKGNFVDLRWRRDRTNFALQLIDRRGGKSELGVFDAAMLQQAIAYAADGRGTAVTIMNTATGSRVQKVHLHPALDHTKIGCQLIDLDKLIFDGTPDSSDWAKWSAVIRAQAELYRDTVLILKDKKPLFAPSKSGLRSIFPQGWSAKEPARTLFSSEPDIFDPSIAQALGDCVDSADGSRDGYWTCVIKGYLSDPRSLNLGQSPRERADRLKDLPVPTVALLSGVRERDFTMAAANFVARGRAFDAILNFSYLAVVDGTAANGRPPWTFPMLGDQARRAAMRAAAAHAERATNASDIAKFTIAQRLARAGLEGRLGPDFPRQRFLDLLRAARTAGKVPRIVTPRWMMSRMEVERERTRLATGFERQRSLWIRALQNGMRAGDKQPAAGRLTRCLSAMQNASIASFDPARMTNVCEVRNDLFADLDRMATAFRFDDAMLATQPASSFRVGAQCGLPA